MPIWEKSKASFNVKIAWWLLLVVICTHFCLVYLQSSQPFLNLNDYVQGKAPLPYQYRILMAWLLREGLRVPSLAAVSAHFPPPLRDPRLVILFVTSWFSLFGSVLLTWLEILAGSLQQSTFWPLRLSWHSPSSMRLSSLISQNFAPIE